MTRSLGRVLAPSIRVVLVSPGWVLGECAECMPPEVLEAQREAAPLRRLATADDVAASVSTVVGDFPFTTGSIVRFGVWPRRECDERCRARNSEALIQSVAEGVGAR